MNRNLFRVLAVTTFGCGCLAAQNSAPSEDVNEIDSQPARVFRTTVRDALNREDFPQLENTAATVRVDKFTLSRRRLEVERFLSHCSGPWFSH